MKRFWIRKLLVALAVSIVGAGIVEAAAPGSKTRTNSARVSTTTSTEAETTASLAGSGTQTVSKGRAESCVVTVTNTVTNTTTTNSSLEVSVKKLTLANNAIVTFKLNGTSLGTATVKTGKAKLRLSTKKGNTVPAVAAGDTVTVVDPDGTTIDLTGAFGPITTDSENAGD
jgi:hypothetical protein